MNKNYILANRTDVGCVRSVNEDSMVTFDSPNGRVVAVCDGMGGQAAGDVASKLACDIIADIIGNNRFATPSEAITRATMAANQGVLHRASQNPEMQGMGATCVMAIIKDGLVYYGWVGDSRIYYVSEGSIQQLSRDQSYVQQLVDAGQLSGFEAEHHPQKNEITNALGVEGMTPPELCVTPLRPEEGSVIMLCSDGLSGMVDADTMRDVISDVSMPLQQRADALVEIAKANGGSDNITVQLIEFGNRHDAVVPPPMEANTEQKSKMMTYGLIIAAIVVVGILAWFVISGGDKKEKEERKVITTEAPVNSQTDSRHDEAEQSKPTNNVSTTEVHKHTTVVRKNEPAPKSNTTTKKETPKSQTNKTQPKSNTKDNGKAQSNNNGNKANNVIEKAPKNDGKSTTGGLTGKMEEK